jgi:hypothetical protein
MVDKVIPLVQAKKIRQKDVLLDPKGFFVIEVYDKKIHVEYYTNVYKNKKNVSGELQKVFEGIRADALSDTIAQHCLGLLSTHYLYLGRELQRAQDALERNKKYVQGGC